MSHTIGQDKHDNQQSNSNSSQVDQDSQQPENNTSNPNLPLSDADYEFLFNQLLEGITHGWHDRRIIKFFARLNERAKQEDWIAWLERIKPKLVKLPTQSKYQLGTIMIRLGELTKSTAEVNRIGAVSHRLGQELLQGDQATVIWEYVGPDWESKATTLKIETESELSERLPVNFVALGSNSIAEKESAQLSLGENQTPAVDNEHANPDLLDSAGENLPDLTPTSDSSIKDDRTTEAIIETSESVNASLDSTDLGEITSSYSEEFEFESHLSEPKFGETSGRTEHLPENNRWQLFEADNRRKISSDQHSSDLPLAATEEELASIARGIESLADRAATTEAPSPWDEDPSAIDMQQVMYLIQEDRELAQQISQKLDISLTSIQQDRAVAPDELEKSTLELIESWFNLGLKQVSAGKFEQAIASWEKALNIDPNLSEAWHNRGSALGRLGKYEAAVESFQNALAIDPHNCQAWNDRAHALYQLQNWSEAVESWSNALKIMPGNHLFWYNRGCALEQLEQWQEAIASYEKSLEIKPDFKPGRSRYINLVADNSRSN